VAALAAFPESPGLSRGRRPSSRRPQAYAEAVNPLSKAVARRSNDAEALYYLGSPRRSRETQKARFAWDQAAALPGWRAVSLLQLGRLAAREGDPAEGLRIVQSALAESPEMIRAGGMEVALLRRTGRLEEARHGIAHWRSIDPPSSFLRHEATLLGTADEALWAHLAGDPERVPRAGRGLHGARPLGRRSRAPARRYPAAGVVAEPGMVLPQDYPLVAYYRATAPRSWAVPAPRTSPSPRASRLASSSQPPESAVVLRGALEVNPKDATAHFFLGSLSWPAARPTRPWRVGARAALRPAALRTAPRHRLHPPLRARAAADALRVFEEAWARTRRTSSSTRAPTRL